MLEPDKKRRKPVYQSFFRNADGSVFGAPKGTFEAPPLPKPPPKIPKKKERRPQRSHRP